MRFFNGHLTQLARAILGLRSHKPACQQLPASLLSSAEKLYNLALLDASSVWSCSAAKARILVTLSKDQGPSRYSEGDQHLDCREMSEQQLLSSAPSAPSQPISTASPPQGLDSDCFPLHCFPWSSQSKPSDFCLPSTLLSQPPSLCHIRPLSTSASCWQQSHNNQAAIQHADRAASNASAGPSHRDLRAQDKQFSGTHDTLNWSNSEANGDLGDRSNLQTPRYQRPQQLSHNHRPPMQRVVGRPNQNSGNTPVKHVF